VDTTYKEAQAPPASVRSTVQDNCSETVHEQTSGRAATDRPFRACPPFAFRGSMVHNLAHAPQRRRPRVVSSAAHRCKHWHM
jgi:hypothetical protein